MIKIITFIFVSAVWFSCAHFEEEPRGQTAIKIGAEGELIAPCRSWRMSTKAFGSLCDFTLPGMRVYSAHDVDRLVDTLALRIDSLEKELAAVKSGKASLQKEP